MKITKTQLKKIIKEELRRAMQSDGDLITRAAEIFAYEHEPRKGASTSYPELTAMADEPGIFNEDDLFEKMQEKLVAMGVDFDEGELMQFIRNI